MKLPEIQKISALCEKMRERLLKLEEIIEKREDYFNDKSEKWQESEVGCNYSEETELLQDNLLELENEIESIEAAVINIQELEN